jgi:hypothetical protein
VLDVNVFHGCLVLHFSPRTCDLFHFSNPNPPQCLILPKPRTHWKANPGPSVHGPFFFPSDSIKTGEHTKWPGWSPLPGGAALRKHNVGPTCSASQTSLLYLPPRYLGTTPLIFRVWYRSLSSLSNGAYSGKKRKENAVWDAAYIRASVFVHNGTLN